MRRCEEHVAREAKMEERERGAWACPKLCRPMRRLYAAPVFVYLYLPSSFVPPPPFGPGLCLVSGPLCRNTRLDFCLLVSLPGAQSRVAQQRRPGAQAAGPPTEMTDEDEHRWHRATARATDRSRHTRRHATGQAPGGEARVASLPAPQAAIKLSLLDGVCYG